MQRSPNITFHGVDHSEALEQHIRDRITKLEEFHPRITGCSVSVEKPHKHHVQGNQFNVRLVVNIPGSQVVVNHDHSEDIQIALRDAFDAAGRRIEDQIRRQRGDIKHHDQEPPG